MLVNADTFKFSATMSNYVRCSEKQVTGHAKQHELQVNIC